MSIKLPPQAVEAEQVFGHDARHLGRTIKNGVDRCLSLNLNRAGQADEKLTVFRSRLETERSFLPSSAKNGSSRSW